MFPITRLFESEQAARDAIATLADDDEISIIDTTIINATDLDAAGRVDAAIHRGELMSGHRRALKEALAKGRSIVSVTPGYGMSGDVVNSLKRSGAVDTHTIPEIPLRDPAPFSDFFGIPVLTEGKSNTELFDFDKESSLGLPLLSSNPAPLSSMFRLKLLSKHKSARGTSIQRMSGKPDPFSSKLGLKLLTSKHGGSARGSAVERMSGKAAPFSSFLGLRVLSRRD